MMAKAAVICSVVFYKNINYYINLSNNTNKLINLKIIKMIHTFPFLSLFNSCFELLLLDFVITDVVLIASKGASYSSTVPINLLDSSLMKPSFCLNKRRGS